MLATTHVKYSVYYFLKSKFESINWGTGGWFADEYLYFRDSYLNDDEMKRVVTRKNMQGLEAVEIVLPVVTLEYIMQTPTAFQLGSGPATSRDFLVTVYGNDDKEVDEIGQQIYEWLLENDIPLNNYNDGFPPDVTPDQVGLIELDDPILTPIRVIGSPNIADRYKIEITFRGTTYTDLNSSELFV